ncbi:MAG: alpha/beta hydrolase [Planctomycetia bacterium]|nr:alpha/beta hydrolase [Planctomycetia bacterium]
MNNKPLFALLLAAFAIASSPADVSRAQDAKKSAPLHEHLKQRYRDWLEIRFDQPYAETDDYAQMLDLYLPKKPKSDRPLPVVVFVHGGGWKSGSRKSYSSGAGELAMQGRYAAVTIGYRLSGTAPWPAQIHDCKAAIRWIRAHAKELNIDPDRIGCTGGSAGGHLALLLGVSGDTTALDGNLGKHLDASGRVQCVVNFCGPSDLLAPLGPGIADRSYTDPLVRELLGGTAVAKPDAAKAASPLTYISAKTVPIMTIHGTADTAVDYQHAEKLDAALKKAGAVSLLIPMIDGGHGVPATPDLVGRIQAFWDLYLLGIQSEISTAPIVVLPATVPPPAAPKATASKTLTPKPQPGAKE